MPSTTFFNAHHSPIGAFASFTFGCKGALGGFGLELNGPANENVYVGVEEADRPGKYKALPFYDSGVHENLDDFDVEGLRDYQFQKNVTPFEDGEISRELGACIDTWKAGDLTFRVASPITPVPDPERASTAGLKRALVPAIYAEITIDNRHGKNPRKAFFGYAGSARTSNMRPLKRGGLTGIGQGHAVAIASDDPSIYSGIGFQPEATLDRRFDENANFMLGKVGLLVAEVPAGEIKTIRFAIGFYRAGAATTGIEAHYLYTHWFERVEDVLDYALTHHEAAFEDAEKLDAKIRADLPEDRAIMLAHAMRSYYGATQCLKRCDTGSPLWVVNEGEYRMMNTFDLTVDQLFHELAMNPWTVRNVLDLYVAQYSYEDRVKFPGSAETHPGGIVFTHDMGVANAFSEEGYSCYEQGGLRGVFSYMSSEELVNWALCACLYVNHTGDDKWLFSKARTFTAVLQSLMNRDHPEPAKRNGVMGLDSSRCKTGSEITTYDSLDASLGQARNNLYLAVKTWAAYCLLDPIYRKLGEADLSEQAERQAKLCAKTIVAAADQDGHLPAVLGEGIEARIIPAIEGLIYPYVAGRADLLEADGPYGALRQTLERHFDAILRPGICLFPDGGWRLSSTSRNSWLSKIYLCQFVAEEILGKPADYRADKSHLGWLMDEDNVYFAWSDQMLAGKAHGSRYYPRGVTSVLWLARPGRPTIEGLRNYLLGGAPSVDVL
jgi:xylan 1,4-beta-xylosidase